MTVVGMGKEKIEYCGSLVESETGRVIVLASRELSREIGVGAEMRLTLVSEGKIEIRMGRVAQRDGRILTFAILGETVAVRRRMEARISARFTVEYKTQSGEFQRTQTQDISSNGLALVELPDAPLPEQTQLRLNLPVAPDANRAIVARGGVVNRRILRGGETVAGIMLVEMAAKDRAVFHQFLADCSDQKIAVAA